ncbi:hypothetical protein [Desulfonatronospira sp. MSAO_Bac3]|nr:hypothetical protein [Desulfonatronospira sp. MSAO_Bac3]
MTLKNNIVFVISLLAILVVILAGIFSADALDRWSAWLHGEMAGFI